LVLENRLVVRLGGSIPFRIVKISLACGISQRDKNEEQPLIRYPLQMVSSSAD